MRKRTFHTSVNLLVEPETYQRLKMVTKLEKTTMSRLIRGGINLKLAEIDKKNDAVIQEEQ